MGERALSKIELVMVSVVFACRHFCHYLLRQPFVFLTSYTFLPELINGVNMSKEVKKWVIELQEFEFSFFGVRKYECTFGQFVDLQGDSFFD